MRDYLSYLFILSCCVKFHKIVKFQDSETIVKRMALYQKTNGQACNYFGKCSARQLFHRLKIDE